jgi:hypothetical protein
MLAEEVSNNNTILGLANQRSLVNRYIVWVQLNNPSKSVAGDTVFGVKRLGRPVLNICPSPLKERGRRERWTPRIRGEYSIVWC